MTTIELTINNKTHTATKTGNLYHYTFIPTQPNQTINIHHLGCFGDTEVRRIQLERGDKPTHFVEPSWFESELSGLLKDMRAIKVEIRDEESELWSRIIANAKGLLIEYHNNEFSSSLAQTAEQLTTLIEDKERKLNSTITQTADGLNVKVDDLSKNISSELTILSDAIDSKVADVDSKLSSRITQTINGFNVQVDDLSRDMNSQFSILSGQINAKVSREDVQSIIGQSGDAIWLMVKDRVPDGKMTGEEIKSAINLTRDGVRIKGNLVEITGDTYIQNGVIKNAHIGDLSANKITTGTLDAGRVTVVNMDVNNLTGNMARFIEALFDGRNSKVKIDSTGMKVMTNSGNYSTHFHDNGLNIYRDGEHVGSIHSLNASDKTGPYVGLKSMSLTTQPESYVSLSYYSMQTRTFIRGFSLGGDGRLRLHIPLYDGLSNRGWRVQGNIKYPIAMEVGTSQDGTAWQDAYTGRRIAITEDGDFWMPTKFGYIVSISAIYDRLKKVEAQLRGDTPKDETTAPKPTTPIDIGDVVKLRAGVTTYYDQDDRAVTIPTNKNGINYRTAEYVVRGIKKDSETWRRNGYYRLTIDGWDIAWARKEDVVKV